MLETNGNTNIFIDLPPLDTSTALRVWITELPSHGRMLCTVECFPIKLYQCQNSKIDNMCLRNSKNWLASQINTVEKVGLRPATEGGSGMG